MKAENECSLTMHWIFKSNHLQYRYTDLKSGFKNAMRMQVAQENLCSSVWNGLREWEKRNIFKGSHWNINKNYCIEMDSISRENGRVKGELQKVV